jgi:predicted flap endonuclease-1-like 5' DNA nuclease
MVLSPEALFEADPGTQSLPLAWRRPEVQARPYAMSLHISKLRGVTNQVRQRLKREGIVYSHQLIAAARDQRGRRRLAASTGVEEPELARLTRRADLARVHGIGAIFADMLERLGVDGTLPLAGEDPTTLHRSIARLNATEQLARRAPTPEEVASWIVQAAALVEDDELSDSSSARSPC